MGTTWFDDGLGPDKCGSNDRIALKREFEEMAAEVLRGLSKMETIIGQGRSGKLGPCAFNGALVVEKDIEEARKAVKKAQNTFSAGLEGFTESEAIKRAGRLWKGPHPPK